MWPNEFAQMLVEVTGATGQASGLVTIFALFTWYAMGITWLAVMGAAGYGIIRGAARLLKTKGNGKEWWS